MCQVRALLEMWVLFKAGPYMRKYEMQGRQHALRSYCPNMYTVSESAWTLSLSLWPQEPL